LSKYPSELLLENSEFITFPSRRHAQDMLAGLVEGKALQNPCQISSKPLLVCFKTPAGSAQNLCLKVNPCSQGQK